MNRIPELPGSDKTQHAAQNVPQLATLRPYASEPGPLSYFVTAICVAVLLAGLALSIVDDPAPRHASVYTPVAQLRFEDAALRTCVLDEAAQNGWSVSGEVRSLHCSHPDTHKVTSLAGIENLVNLEEVDLSENAITDTALLGRLRRLETLDLSGNEIAAPELHGLRASLRSLGLDRNQLTTLDWVRELPQLESLSVAHNHIHVADALAGHDRLRMLNLAYNEVSDVAPLLQLAHLEVLDLEANPLNDAAPLEQLQSLLFLELGAAPSGVGPRQVAEKSNIPLEIRR